jgi:hypothetical protein
MDYGDRPKASPLSYESMGTGRKPVSFFPVPGKTFMNKKLRIKEKKNG